MSNKKQANSLDLDSAISSQEAFINKYKKPLTIGAIAIVAAILLCIGIKYWLGQRENKAQTQLALGQTYFMQNDFDKALKGDGKTFEGFLKISDGYSFTDAANIAHAYAGICYAKQEKYQEAINQLESFKPQDDATISPAIMSTLANCYAATKQIDKAIETFIDAADKADNDAFSPMLLMDAARLLETQGKKAEANKLYTRVKEEYTTSMQASPNLQGNTFVAPEIDKYIERTK